MELFKGPRVSDRMGSALRENLISKGETDQNAINSDEPFKVEYKEGMSLG